MCVRPLLEPTPVLRFPSRWLVRRLANELGEKQALADSTGAAASTRSRLGTTVPRRLSVARRKSIERVTACALLWSGLKGALQVRGKRRGGGTGGAVSAGDVFTLCVHPVRRSLVVQQRFCSPKVGHVAGLEHHALAQLRRVHGHELGLAGRLNRPALGLSHLLRRRLGRLALAGLLRARGAQRVAASRLCPGPAHDTRAPLPPPPCPLPALLTPLHRQRSPGPRAQPPSCGRAWRAPAPPRGARRGRRTTVWAPWPW